MKAQLTRLTYRANSRSFSKDDSGRHLSAVRGLLLAFRLLIVITTLTVKVNAQDRITGYDGEMFSLLHRHQYTLNPNPEELSPVTPFISGQEGGYPVSFDLKASPGSLWEIYFLLPDSVKTPLEGVLLPLSFSSRSAMVFDGSTRSEIDPKHRRRITIGADSLARFYLGATITMGEFNRTEWLSTIFRCVAISEATGEILHASAKLIVETMYDDRTGFDDGELSGLAAGHEYTLHPRDPGIVRGMYSGNERGTPMRLVVDFGLEPHPTNFRLRFTLPRSFVGATRGSLPSQFGDGSAYWLEGDVSWNPHEPSPDMIVPAGGIVNVLLGITVSVPDSTYPDDYTATVAATIEIWSESGGGLTSASAGAVYTVSVDEYPDFPSLEQNFPNPFNSNSTITYKLPALSHTRLSVHNVLGEELAVLFDKVQSAGAHQAVWDATGFPSGIYFYRLRLDGFTDFRKMSLVR